MTREEFKNHLKFLKMSQAELAEYLGTSGNLNYALNKKGEVPPYIAVIIEFMVENQKLKSILESLNEEE